MRCSSDRGQVGSLVLLLVVTAMGVAVLMAALGGVLVDRTRARSASDAAALAGAIDGAAAAQQVAVANGGTVESFVVDGVAVEVTVRVGRARATSRATAGVEVSDAEPFIP